MKKISMNKRIVIISIFLILFILFWFFLLKNKKAYNFTIEDSISISEEYIFDLKNRLYVVNFSENIEDSLLKKKLYYIDKIYKDGLINISEKLYYMPKDLCWKKVCFSIRETYLFNFNFPLNEW